MSTANGKSEMKVENFPNLGNKQIKLFKKNWSVNITRKKKKFPWRNNKQQTKRVKGKSWSRGTISRLPFAVNVVLLVTYWLHKPFLSLVATSKPKQVQLLLEVSDSGGAAASLVDPVQNRKENQKYYWGGERKGDQVGHWWKLINVNFHQWPWHGPREL